MGLRNVDELATVLVVAIALLDQVNGRVYRTNEAIVFEIDRTWDGSFLAKSFPLSQSDFVPINSFMTGNIVPNSHMPSVETSPSEMNSHSIDLHPLVVFRSGKALKQQSKENNARCGAGPHKSRINGGQEAAKNSWPFVVGFMKPDSGLVDCGGSLISETQILTAAHCFERKSMFQLSQIVVKLGMHHRGDGNGKQDDALVTRRISNMAIHKGYNTGNRYFDIAIVTMDSPVAYSKAISPVCLPPAIGKRDVYAGETAIILGWGKLGVEEGFSPTLMQASVPIMTNDECRRIYSEPGQIPNHMLCTSSTSSDACDGDNGGPLVVKTKDDNAWYQAGIVSWRRGCASATHPASVYTRVNWLRGWINGNLKN